MKNIAGGITVGGPELVMSGPLPHHDYFAELAEDVPVYRLRVHIRGRDASQGWIVFKADEDDGEPLAEEHLIVMWPAPAAPEIRWKLTDQRGAQSRAAKPFEHP